MIKDQWKHVDLLSPNMQHTFWFKNKDRAKKNKIIIQRRVVANIGNITNKSCP